MNTNKKDVYWGCSCSVLVEPALSLPQSTSLICWCWLPQGADIPWCLLGSCLSSLENPRVIRLNDTPITWTAARHGHTVMKITWMCILQARGISFFTMKHYKWVGLKHPPYEQWLKCGSDGLVRFLVMLLSYENTHEDSLISLIM